MFSVQLVQKTVHAVKKEFAKSTEDHERDLNNEEFVWIYVKDHKL